MMRGVGRWQRVSSLPAGVATTRRVGDGLAVGLRAVNGQRRREWPGEGVASGSVGAGSVGRASSCGVVGVCRHGESQVREWLL